jgi:tetratricopeptide (TPR) repeat protein
VGNLYRKENQNDTAITYFKKAAELGTTNNKLYYLLASLLFEKGDLDEADRNIKKSMSIRSDYPKALKLNREIENSIDKEGPKIILYEPSTRRGMKVVKTYENLTVRGISTDKSGVAWVKVNQQETPLDEHGNFLKDIPIQLGANTIRVEAADMLTEDLLRLLSASINMKSGRDWNLRWPTPTPLKIPFKKPALTTLP